MSGGLLIADNYRDRIRLLSTNTQQFILKVNKTNRFTYTFYQT